MLYCSGSESRGESGTSVYYFSNQVSDYPEISESMFNLELRWQVDKVVISALFYR